MEIQEVHTYFRHVMTGKHKGLWITDEDLIEVFESGLVVTARKALGVVDIYDFSRESNFVLRMRSTKSKVETFKMSALGDVFTTINESPCVTASWTH